MVSSTDLTASNHNWEVFTRFGITDNIEARLYTGGLAAYDVNQHASVGFLPLTLDTKLHLARHFWSHFNFSLGLEAYVQTTWGSAGFTNGIQYSVNMLLDHSLPWKVSYDWILGLVLGAGLQWTVTDRWVLFGSFNVGVGDLAPLLSGNLGAAMSL